MARFAKGVQFLGLAMSVLISVQICSAQLWVQGYSEDDEHIGWAVGTDNSNCKLFNAAEADYLRKGGTRKGLYRFPAAQQPCGPDIYGCYALVRGVTENGRKVYAFVSSSGVLSESDAIRAATDNAIRTVPLPRPDTITVLVSGCAAAPSATKPPGQDPTNSTAAAGGSEAIKGRILANLRANIRAGTYDDEVSAVTYSNVSVQFESDSLLIKYKSKFEIEDGTEESEVSIRYPLSSLRSMAFRGSNFERLKEKGLGFLVTANMTCSTRPINSPGSEEADDCGIKDLPYDPGPNNQNFNALKALMQMLK